MTKVKGCIENTHVFVQESIFSNTRQQDGILVTNIHVYQEDCTAYKSRIKHYENQEDSYASSNEKDYQKIVRDINEMIDEARNRKFPIAECRIDDHCNTIGQKILSLLLHILGRQSTDLPNWVDTNSYERRNNYFKSIISDKLERHLNNTCLQEKNHFNILRNFELFLLPDCFGITWHPPLLWPQSIHVQNPMAIFFIIFCNLQYYEFQRLKHKNNEQLSFIKTSRERDYDEVAHFLAQLKLEHLYQKFVENNFIPKTFKDLTDEKLHNAGITVPGDQLLITEAAKNYLMTCKCMPLLEEEQKKNKQLEDELSLARREIENLKKCNNSNTCTPCNPCTTCRKSKSKYSRLPSIDESVVNKSTQSPNVTRGRRMTTSD